MSSRTGKFFVVIVAAAVVGLALLPATSASALTRCKPPAVVVGALTQGQAISAWSQRVRGQLGAVWSNFNLARNKSFTQQNLGVATKNFVSAVPCRRY